MKRSRWGSALIVAVLLTVGVVFIVNRAVFAAPDPSSLAARARPMAPGSFHELGNLPWRDGHVVFYTVGRYQRMSRGPVQTVFGVAFYQDRGFLHVAHIDLWEDANRLGAIDVLTNQDNNHWVVAGRVSDPGATAVLLHAGSVKTQVRVQKGGLFLLVSPSGTEYVPTGQVIH